MRRGSKGKYTDKQKRQAEHIEESYRERGKSEGEAERRAWATVEQDDRRRQEERLGPRQGGEQGTGEEGRPQGGRGLCRPAQVRPQRLGPKGRPHPQPKPLMSTLSAGSRGPGIECRNSHEVSSQRSGRDRSVACRRHLRASRPQSHDRLSACADHPSGGGPARAAFEAAEIRDLRLELDRLRAERDKLLDIQRLRHGSAQQPAPPTRSSTTSATSSTSASSTAPLANIDSLRD